MSKNYKSNPALNFISEQAPKDKAPEGMKLNPEYIAKYIEKRTRRVQIILQPSLYERAKEKAKSSGVSFNDYIHALLEADNPNTDNSDK